MATHEPTYYTNEAQHYVVCSCRFRTDHGPTKQAAEDLYFKHMKQVEQVRTHLASKTPSLKSCRDYYQAMADDTRKSVTEREQWSMLAGELTRRIGRLGQDTPLPF